MGTVGEPMVIGFPLNGWTGYLLVDDAFFGSPGESICHQQSRSWVYLSNPLPSRSWLANWYLKCPKMNLPAGEESICWLSPRPRNRKGIFGDPLVYNAFTARWAASMLQAIDEVHAYAPKYTQLSD